MPLFHRPNAKRPDEALHHAVRRGELHEKARILRGDADVNALAKDGNTLLIYASLKGHLKLVKMQLACGAQMNITNDNDVYALMYAALNGRLEVVEQLLKHGADVNQTTHHGSALHKAAQNGHEQVVEALLARGANINETFEFGTALGEAARYEHAAVVEARLESGADVHCTGKITDTLLHDAGRRENHHMALALWPAGSDLFRKNSCGDTPLFKIMERYDECCAVKQMRDIPRLHRAPFSADEAKLRKKFKVLASKFHSDGQTVTVQDAISEVQRILQQHLRRTRAGITVQEPRENSLN